ncbi:hypothetical protein CROQUDRAFT_90508 [Cronartium quercuum f. sp. fusiforme G11]|uniref:Uncharacterized protein n=1 Tax=Cronartium quercuum f. sp. fusiforme G11 TaxID=708437 RepID=A0A9P6TDA7_9BASI|nr:hypothetical protein CROQUDRAFT_90508 [Cronartium quercuum f. sp. fusiforme G11]
MMWGLYKLRNVPPTTDVALLKEFYTWFNSTEEVKLVVNNPSSTDLIAQESIMSLKELCTSGWKIAHGLGHIDEIAFFISVAFWPRLLPKTPAVLEFKCAPKNLPIDFYNPNWFKELNPAQKQLIADAENVTFLPDASQSLLPTRHPDKQLGDAKFTAKYLDVFLEVYDLSDDKGEGFAGTDENEDSGQSDESLDSDVEAKENDEEESEFYEEGQYGDLYDDEANKSGDDDE